MYVCVGISTRHAFGVIAHSHMGAQGALSLSSEGLFPNPVWVPLKEMEQAREILEVYSEDKLIQIFVDWIRHLGQDVMHLEGYRVLSVQFLPNIQKLNQVMGNSHKPSRKIVYKRNGHCFSDQDQEAETS